MDVSGDPSAENLAVEASFSPSVLSPNSKSRYGRTRRPKVSEDFYNIDDVIIEENPPTTHPSNKSPKLSPKSSVVKLDGAFEIEDEFTKIDDLELKVANNFKANLQRGLDDSIKERKFFKSMSENKSDVSVVDVTKVFKLISTKSPVSEVQEAKLPPKSALKTYSNKRKHIHDSDSFIIESFGLPDEPIVPVSNPFVFERDNKIDIDMSCEDDVNLSVPWTFDDFQHLPLYASEPITTIEDFGFSRSGLVDLLSNDNMLTKSIAIDKVLDAGLTCSVSEKSRIPLPAVPTIKESAKCERETKAGEKKDNLNKSSVGKVALRNSFLTIKHVSNTGHKNSPELDTFAKSGNDVSKNSQNCEEKLDNVEKDNKVFSLEKNQVINENKRVLRSSIDIEETHKAKEKNDNIEHPLSRKRMLRSSINSEEEVNDNSKHQNANDEKQVLKKPKIKKAISSLKKTTKAEMSAKRILRSSIDNNNIEMKESLVFPLSEENIMNNNVQSQVINPVRLSKIMLGPQVRILLNPLSCVDKIDNVLGQNPYKINSENLELEAEYKNKLQSSSNNINRTNSVGNEEAVKKSDNEEIEAENLDVKQIKTENIDFQVGDITWAKIGSHPYWPCMITEDPELGNHKKFVVHRVNPLYHVRFFGDRGRRSWVTAQHIMPYSGRDDLNKIAIALKAEGKRKASYIKEAYTVKSTKLIKWQKGVDEAEMLKTKSEEERVNYFFQTPARKTERAKKLKEPRLTDDNSQEIDLKKRSRISEIENESKRIKREPIEDVVNTNLTNEELNNENINNEESRRIDDVQQTQELIHKSPKKNKKTLQSIDAFKSPEVPKKCGSPDKRKRNGRKSFSGDENTETNSPELKKNIRKTSEPDEDTSVVLHDVIEQGAPFSFTSKELKKTPRRLSQIGETDENETSDKRIINETNADTPRSVIRRRFSKKEETEDLSEARKKLRNYQNRNEITEILESRKENQESNKKSKRTSVEESSHQESEDMEDDTPKLRNKRHHITSEYSNSDTDSKFSDNSSVPTSLESQAILYRRNNIFRGIPKEKVCQICEKGGEVFKCKGPCSGVYHYECAMRPIKYEECEDVKTEIEEPKEEKSNVEIISVNSKRPLPNLSDSPNFKGMSLAEKIDYRMKEIMKKFDYQSMYAESTDSSSEEYLIDESFEKIKNQSKLSLTVTNKPTKKEVPIIKHVTADHISYICVTNEPPKDKETATLVKDLLKCCWCLDDETPNCLVCNEKESRSGSNFRQKCSLHQCGKFYHPECLKLWPQTQWSLIRSTKDKKSDEKYDTFVCPRHVCHTCISDDPRASNSRCPSDKVVKCLKCPATYHSSNYCVPAGTHIITTSQIVCPRHYSREKSKKRAPLTINTNWCFICSKGGDLICCETCPTSVHVECLPGDLNEVDTFYCEDCQSGRLPLYDEIVWVKLGSFRWWPALILFPNEVPDNVKNIAHNKGEFVVKFFGTYDHYWVGRGRTFLFQEGDKGHSHSVRNRVDNAFAKAIEEAAAAHQLKKQFKLNKVAEKNSGLKPPPYIRIKVNKPVGNVRFGDCNISNTTSCDCDPNQPHPCGPDSDCLNRLLLTECNPEVCPAGDRCNNQCFEKREYPPLIPHRTHARGWGLKTLAPIRKGQFVIEYVGEVIDEQEYQRRIQKMHEQKEENYYFLTIDKDRTLDAGPKGNVARFMNHSCQPNCETQKWTVNGDTRVGLFAKCDIPADTELTFNYNLECIGKEKKICRCGAPNCSGFIGVKVKSDVPPKKSNKPKKKKTPPPLEIVNNDNPCFICGKMGDVGACNNKICTKYYHLECVGLTSWPEGGKWVCQWHNCNICSKRTIRCCVLCVNSYCPSHSEGCVRYDKLLGFVCFEHDPTKEQNTVQSTEVIPKNNETNVNTDEGAVTSTTPDEAIIEMKDTNEDSLDVKSRLNGFVTSTPLKKTQEDSSQDESTVSSASTSDVTVENKNKNRKKKMKKKAAKKKVEVQVKNTANLFNTMQNEVKLSKFTPVKYLRTSRNSIKVLNQTDPEKDLPIRKRTRLRCGNTL